ncbi:MAG TPA: hypothetical protein VKU92_12865 [Acidimicrobiales bacterium]|nr:hypothetical protein [Acidimicrobiales bacterium]
MSRTNDPKLEELLARSLAARAATVTAEPDLADLERRIARRRPLAGAAHPRARLAAAVATVLVASGAGVALGSALLPGRTERAILSSAGGADGGALPRGPIHASRSSTGRPPVLGPFASSPDHGLLSLGPLLGGSVVERAEAAAFSRSVGGGITATASAELMAPLAISTTGASGCYVGELVETTVRLGAAVGRSLGVAAVPALGPGGLEVVDSGMRPLGPGREGSYLWWATVAVGPGVASVAAEQPDGATSTAVPTGGLAVVAGVAPAAAASRFFSVVAETASGAPLHSLGFLTGWGPRAVGAVREESSGSAGANPDAACTARRAAGVPARVLPGLPVASLLAAGSAAAAVISGPTLGVPRDVQVEAVRLLSSASAEVLYRAGDGVLRTAAVRRDGSGGWKLSG